MIGFFGLEFFRFRLGFFGFEVRVSGNMSSLTDEFRELHQGNKSVEEYTYQFIELARYTPEEVDNDEKKPDIFKKGLNPELWTLLTPQIYPDFNTLMNMAILKKGPKLKKGGKISASSWKVRPANRTVSRNQGAPVILHQDLRPQCSIGPSHK